MKAALAGNTRLRILLPPSGKDDERMKWEWGGLLLKSERRSSLSEQKQDAAEEVSEVGSEETRGSVMEAANDDIEDDDDDQIEDDGHGWLDYNPLVISSIYIVLDQSKLIASL